MAPDTPSPRHDSTAAARADRPPSGDFEWPPADDLSIHAIGTDLWSSHTPRTEPAAAASDPPREPAARRGWRGRPDSSAALLVAMVVVVLGVGWGLTRDVAQPRPAEAAAPSAESPPSAAERTAVATEAMPTSSTIVITYPVDRPAADTAAPRVPSPVDTATSLASVIAEGVARPSAPAAPLATATAAALDIATPSTATPSTVEMVGAAGPLPAPSPAAAALTPAARIRGLLAGYEAAYDRRDVAAAARLWPSLDQRALARAFASLSRQDVGFERCDIDAGDARGSAVCVGTVRYVPAIGGGAERETRIVWTFDLIRAGDNWRITGLRAR